MGEEISEIYEFGRQRVNAEAQRTRSGAGRGQDAGYTGRYLETLRGKKTVVWSGTSAMLEGLLSILQRAAARQRPRGV